MDDLVAWLWAQLDEDLRGIEDMTKPVTEPLLTSRRDVHEWITDMGPKRGVKRVRDEVEAKRRIVYELGAQASRYRDGDPTTIISPEGRALADQARRYLRLLALPYVDRAGYRAEWRPE